MSDNIIPIRWIISFLGIYSCALLFGERAAMSVAIVSMTRTTMLKASSLSSSSLNSTYYCDMRHQENTSNLQKLSELFSEQNSSNFRNIYDDDDNVEKPEFDWNEKLQVSF